MNANTITQNSTNLSGKSTQKMMDLIVQQGNVVRNQANVNLSSNFFERIIGGDGNSRTSVLHLIAEKLQLLKYENFERFHLKDWSVADLLKFLNMLKMAISQGIQDIQCDEEYAVVFE